MSDSDSDEGSDVGPMVKRNWDLSRLFDLSIEEEDEKLNRLTLSPVNDKEKSRLVTKYLEGKPRYAPEDLQLLHSLVKGEADASAAWPTFHIEAKGRASKFIYAYVLYITYLFPYKWNQM